MINKLTTISTIYIFYDNKKTIYYLLLEQGVAGSNPATPTLRNEGDIK